MATRRVELKPPAELVEAIQNSDDMTVIEDCSIDVHDTCIACIIILLKHS